MNASSELEELLAAESTVSLLRYLSAASLAFALWEHAITFYREYELVWKLSSRSTKWIFLFNRYGLILGLGHSLAVTLALPRRQVTDKLCKASNILILVCVMVDTLGSNVYLALRLHRLWGQKKSILYALLGALITTHGAALCFSILGIKAMGDHITYNRALGACSLSQKPILLIPAWALVIAFDCVMIGVLTLNSLDRPRRRNKELLVYLKSDSATFFAGLYCMRIISLVLLVSMPPTKVFLYSCYIIWPLTSAVMSRFILGSETFKHSMGTHADYLTYEMETRKWRVAVMEK